jgi:hypothetical protein
MTITHFQVEGSEEESEEEEVGGNIIFEEIKFPEFHDPDEVEIHVPRVEDDESGPRELQIHKLEPHELQEYELEEHEPHDRELQMTELHDEIPVHEMRELQDDTLREDELQEGELLAEELEEDSLQEDELCYEEFSKDQLQVHHKSPVDYAELQDDDIWPEGEDVDWPQSYEIITTTTKGHKRGEPEEYPELQFSEFQISVVDHDEAKSGEIVTPALVEDLLSPRRPQIEVPTKPSKPILQHWESRELLENKLERELHLAREFVHARRELPELTPRTRANSKSKPKPKPAPKLEPEPEPELKPVSLELEMDLDADFDMEGLQMESFIVFEYPIDEEREDINFNFNETFTSKSNKYSIYYH